MAKPGLKEGREERRRRTQLHIEKPGEIEVKAVKVVVGV
jgi:hypothetical protein